MTLTAQAVEQRLTAMRECIEMGLSRKEAARHLGASYSTICIYADRFDLAFAKKYAGKKTHDERADAMAALYRNGETLKQIGVRYGLTRERVRQIITKYHGRMAKKGGQHVRTAVRRVKAAASRDAHYLAKYGCTFAQWKLIHQHGAEMRSRGVGAYRCPSRAYMSQRNNARHRGIGWELTLWQWWTIWQESGHWDQRGRGHGYVMCRKGDEGSYAIGNVFIATAAENSSITKQKKSDLPIGVRREKASYAATIMVRGQHIKLGRYPTAEQAHRAYLIAQAEAQRAAA
jgi:transposase